MGAAYGTAKSGVGVASMGVMRPELVMKSIVPVVMAGVLGIYGLIIAVIISTGINPKAKSYYLFDGYAHLSSGLACGLAGLSAGMAIGIVGDAGVRYLYAVAESSARLGLNPDTQGRPRSLLGHRRQRWIGCGPRKFNSNSLTSWLKDKIEATLSRLYHIRARPRRVVGNARHIKASKIVSGSRRVVLMHPGALCSGVFLGSVNRSLVGKSVAFLSARGGKGGGPPNSRVGGAGDIYSHGCSLGAPGDGVLATSGWALLLAPKC
ncbi:hypothetical protein BHM03_00013879 [Ensete ventricosum]|nr:hypothetical protein BHM03_00013879 [Ensete ventricosum]